MSADFKALGRKRGEMNKTEAAHAQYLQTLLNIGEILDYRWQPLRLKLAPECTYEPDFLVILKNGEVQFDEVKGSFITDDALVKVKVAAQMFPYFGFVLYQYDRRGMKVKTLPVL